MEIIHLILGKANPERMNGVNKVVYQLASHQAESGRQVSVWGITKDTSHNYGKRSFDTVLFQQFSNPFRVDNNLKKALLRRKDGITIHLHGGWLPQYIGIARFLIKHQIPYVITPHGAYNSIAMQRSYWVKRLYFKLFEKRLLDGAKKIHAIGESELQGLSKIYRAEKSFLLPYGFKFNPQVGEAQKPSDKLFIIGFIGRLDIYTKGLDLLIKAFDKFQMNAPDATLWIIGDSKEREALNQLIKDKNLDDKVKLWGSKFGTEKDTLMSQMTVFAHPSRNEGLPVAVLEASALGVPSVVTQATNVAAYIAKYHAGFSIENENIEALSAALTEMYQLWQNNKLKTLGQNAQRMVKEAFSWETIVEQFDALYQ